MNAKKTPNRGYSLVELTVTMTAGSAVMILAIGMVRQSMLLASMTRARADQQRANSRLVSQFRFDVCRADECRLQSEREMHLVRGADRPIVWSTSPDGVTRSETINGEQGRFERFRLSPDSVVLFSIDHQDTPRAVLSVASASPFREWDKPQRYVEAAVGRLRRLEKRLSEADSASQSPTSDTSPEESP